MLMIPHAASFEAGVADVADPAPFTRTELLVIGIGERDPVAGPANGRWARLRRALFGIEAPPPFADARLEALRVLAGRPREGRARDAAVAAALAAGISRPQIDHLRSSRPRTPEG